MNNHRDAIIGHYMLSRSDAVLLGVSFFFFLYWTGTIGDLSSAVDQGLNPSSRAASGDGYANVRMALVELLAPPLSQWQDSRGSDLPNWEAGPSGGGSLACCWHPVRWRASPNALAFTTLTCLIRLPRLPG